MDNELHPLLSKQLEQCGINLFKEQLPTSIVCLLNNINTAYYELNQHSDYLPQELLELRESLQKERDVVQSVMLDGLCVFDQDWKIVSLNKIGAAILSTVPEDVIGKSYSSAFDLHEDDENDKKPITKEMIQQYLEKNEVYHWERGYIKLPNGYFSPISFSINRFPKKENEFGGAVLIFRSTKEMLEKELALKTAVKLAQKSNNAKTIFLANMSHEIRTPMNGIMGMLQLLMNTTLSDKQKNYVDKCYESANSLLRTLGDILDLSKIESGKVSFENVQFSMKDEIDSLVAFYSPQCVQKQISLELHYDETIPNLTTGDPHRIKQVISNLISNAIKFTPSSGKIIVELNLIEKNDSSALLQISVTDTGVGIPQEAQSIIFDMFSQADGSTTRKYGGTGLGLAITKQLVELMGGDINVQSMEGKGSIFYFTLSLGLAKGNLVDKSKEPVSPLPKDIKQFHAMVLVVEDNVLNQIVTRHMLGALGCQVEVVGSGEEALEVLSKRKYDLILMDCHMPGLDGFMATRKIRELENKSSDALYSKDKHNIIVALTANALKEAQEQCEQAGMDGYLTKPVQLKQLQALLLKYAPHTLK